MTTPDHDACGALGSDVDRGTADRSGTPRGDGLFLSTRWSVVLRAGETGDSDASREALEFLCRAYWYPLYAYLRSTGQSAEDAKDLTQGFFEHLLSKGTISVDPAGGRYRSFLLRSIRNYTTSEWRKHQAQKRGGDFQIFSVDSADAEQRYRLETMGHDRSPEKLFDHRWARAILEQVFASLRDEYQRAGKINRFEALKGFLLEDPMPGEYEAAAERLGLTTSGLRTQVQRMRARFGQRLRAEIAETVAEPEQVDEELAHLLQSLS